MDGLVLGAVVGVDAPDVRQQGDEAQVGQQYRQPNQPLYDDHRHRALDPVLQPASEQHWPSEEQHRHQCERCQPHAYHRHGAYLLLFLAQGHVGGEDQRAYAQGKGLPQHDDAPDERDAPGAAVHVPQGLAPHGDVAIGAAAGHGHAAWPADHHPLDDRLAAVVQGPV